MHAVAIFAGNRRARRALPVRSGHHALVAQHRLPALVLMLSAVRTVPIHRMVDDVLATTLPAPERVHLPDATHDLWADQPEACRNATLDFLERHAA
jgi:pimeloyl-ACP methyl ester carboxylesterase